MRLAAQATTQSPQLAWLALARWSAVLSWTLTRGIVPLGVGAWLVRLALAASDALLFSVGISCLVAGLALALRALCLGLFRAVVRQRAGALHATALATRIADRITAVVIGGGLALYWSLPFDALASLGLPRFSSGIQIFFIAGIMMVFGVVLAIAPNLDLLLAPLRWALGLIGRLRHATRIALVYPARQRFRTGVGLALFALVCFTMVVMACIAASTSQGYDNLPQQAAGYDIAGQPLFAPVGGVSQVTAALKRGSAGGDIGAVSSATPLPLGIIQPGAPSAGWRLYPVSELQGAFLNGVGLPLVARASGYTTDAAVWNAVRNLPGSVVIDIGALGGGDAAALGVHLPPAVKFTQFLGPPIGAGLPGLSSVEALNANSSGPTAGSQTLSEIGALADNPFALRDFTLRLRGVVAGRGAITPTTIWVSDLRGGPAEKLTVIGLVDNATGHLYGLFGSHATFAPVEQALPPFGNEYYYFQVNHGVDAHAAALAIGATLQDYGFETTVLADVLLDSNGPRVFISRVLVGLVGLTLLVGMAALTVSGSRAVVERRQQIGMLRALGFRRLHVQVIFLLEALLVGLVGTGLGLGLGLILCRNVFAVDFFNQFQSGLVLVIPWRTLGLICGAAVIASLLAALLPAWQAGQVAPADALRYE
ncbi:MAG TPA: FtsX-like permease family protein [Ktedonobacterales bacterium]|nr:FtsX-like permease family protein [Ktedonobacterales bacterium]